MTANQQEFAARRTKLLSQLAPNSVALLFSAPEYIRNGDTDFPYRQDSDFYYLTGFAEPHAVAVLIKEDAGSRYILFNRPRDTEKEIWTGRRAGQAGALEIFGADESLSIDSLDEKLLELIGNKGVLYHTLGLHQHNDQRVIRWLNAVRAKVRTGVQAPPQINTLRQFISEMRLIKSDQEIAWMKKAADISVDAHKRAMQACKPGMMEYQIEAESGPEFNRHGARFLAYPSIVASGANACILHYTDNNMALKDGDLLLIDAGAEYNYYAADITRTFPINGKFSGAQHDLYELVLKSQLAAIDIIREGLVWDKIQETIIKVLTTGLVELGILKGSINSLIEQKAYRPFYMHNSGHWLGMDVHDVGDYKIKGEWRHLTAGMVITVEPGLYIPAGSAGVDKKWWDIGIRIEDDVLVSANGNDVLTKALPKAIADIEVLMAE